MPEDIGGGTEGEPDELDEAALGARKVPRGGGRGAGALRLSVPEELEAILVGVHTVRKIIIILRLCVRNSK